MMDGTHTPVEKEITGFRGEPAKQAWVKLRQFLDRSRILIVLGREESAKALSMRKELSPKMYELIENTKQPHDGRWLWIGLFRLGMSKI